MKLRRVDILGFKSFRAKTGLDIADGVTVVVGPNGCGKSNIVDAIRWAIGSQSAKDLRGRAMEDVIFAGSANHRPLGVAEVSLTFETNERSDVPAAWRDHAEIRITRRLFRTGESEYEINRQRVRLRDVTAEDGIGARARRGGRPGRARRGALPAARKRAGTRWGCLPSHGPRRRGRPLTRAPRPCASI